MASVRARSRRCSPSRRAGPVRGAAPDRGALLPRRRRPPRAHGDAVPRADQAVRDRRHAAGAGARGWLARTRTGGAASSCSCCTHRRQAAAVDDHDRMLRVLLAALPLSRICRARRAVFSGAPKNCGYARARSLVPAGLGVGDAVARVGAHVGYGWPAQPEDTAIMRSPANRPSNAWPSRARAAARPVRPERGRRCRWRSRRSPRTASTTPTCTSRPPAARAGGWRRGS